jgi:hypothetical protein
MIGPRAGRRAGRGGVYTEGHESIRELNALTAADEAEGSEMRSGKSWS